MGRSKFNLPATIGRKKLSGGTLSATERAAVKYDAMPKCQIFQIIAESAHHCCQLAQILTLQILTLLNPNERSLSLFHTKWVD